MFRDDRHDPNDCRYVGMRFISSLWKGSGGLSQWKVSVQAQVGLFGGRESQDQETHNIVQNIFQTRKLNKETCHSVLMFALQSQI